MKILKIINILSILSVFCLNATLAEETPPAIAQSLQGLPAEQWLPAYLNKADPSFEWKVWKDAAELSARTKRNLTCVTEENGAAPLSFSINELHMTSQTWQGASWQHQLVVITPCHLKKPRQALFIVAGEDWSKKYEDLKTDVKLDQEIKGLLKLLYAPLIDVPFLGSISVADVFSNAFNTDPLQFAGKLPYPIVILRQNPFQPQFGTKRESALMSYSFEQALESKVDQEKQEWPLVLPMTKAIMRGMDAINAFFNQTYQSSLEGVVLVGASKQAWASWLTAAQDKQRVKGLVSAAFGFIGIAQQLQHQVQVWGEKSSHLQDYQKSLEWPDQPQLEALLRAIDPLYVLPQITQPKLFITGTNDPYFPVDFLEIFFPQLRGINEFYWVPNFGHSNRMNLNQDALELLPPFFNFVGKTLTASHAVSDASSQLPVIQRSTQNPREILIQLTIPQASMNQHLDPTFWYALSPSRDFRNAEWKKIILREKKTTNPKLRKKDSTPSNVVFEARLSVGEKDAWLYSFYERNFMTPKELLPYQKQHSNLKTTSLANP